MARSIHTTQRDIEEAKRFDFSEDQRRDQLVKDLEEQASIKRRIKRHVSRERSKPEDHLKPTDSEMIPVVVKREGAYVHYPASAEDIRAVMHLLPAGTLDGLHSVELCFGEDRQETDSEIYQDDQDPYTGRLGVEILPSVFSGRCLGTYSTGESRIKLYAYVYNSSLSDREMWECYLRLHMLSSLVHEIAHHYDFSMRVARGRWRMDDRDKGEIYAESVQHKWMQDYIIPYIKQAYQEQIKALGNWIEHHGGVSIPLDLLAGDPRTSMKNGLINITRAWFDVPSAVGQLAKSVYEGKALTETRLGFACDLHYGDDYDRALKIIEDVLAHEPENLEALALKGDIYEHQERYAEARELAEYVVKLDETRENAWHVLAGVYEELEEWLGLIEATTRLLENLELAPMPQARYLCSRAKARLELGDHDGALSDIEAVETIKWRSLKGAPPWIRRKIKELRLVIRQPF